MKHKEYYRRPGCANEFYTHQGILHQRETPLNIDEAIDFFFRDPSIDPVFRAGDNHFSNLYLLRRDIHTCYTRGAVWPGVMAVMAGIDLLGKFFTGVDKSGGDADSVGGRFITFTENYIAKTKEDSEVLYQLRNSLLHNFGLYSKRPANKAEKNRSDGFDFQHYAFRLRGDIDDPSLVKLTVSHPTKLIGSRPKHARILLTEYDVHVYALRTAFEEGIRRYSRHLKRQEDLRQKFQTHAGADIRSFFDMYAVTTMRVEQ